MNRKRAKSHPQAQDTTKPRPGVVNVPSSDAPAWAHPTLDIAHSRDPLPAAWTYGDVGFMLEQPAPPVKWLVPDFIPAETPGIFASEGGVGKSMMSLHISLSITSGRGIMGRLPSRDTSPGVVYVSMEDDPNEFHRRISRLINLMRQSPDWSIQDEANIKANFRPIFPKRATGADFRLEDQWKNIQKVANSIPGGCGLIWLDTFSRLSDGDENSADQVKPFLDAQAALVETTGASVLPLHHVAKGNSIRSDQPIKDRLHHEAIRGNSAIVNNVRFALMLATLNTAEASTANLDPEKAQLGDYVGFRLSKMNSGPQQPITLLERIPNGMPGAGFLKLHERPEEAIALIQGSSAVAKLNKRDEVLCAIAEAGGIHKLDIDATMKRLWPRSENPKSQWHKHVSDLRHATPALLADVHLTEAGWTKAKDLGVSSGRNSIEATA